MIRPLLQLFGPSIDSCNGLQTLEGASEARLGAIGEEPLWQLAVVLEGDEFGLDGTLLVEGRLELDEGLSLLVRGFLEFVFGRRHSAFEVSDVLGDLSSAGGRLVAGEELLFVLGIDRRQPVGH